MAKGQKKKFLGVLAVILVLCVIAVVAYFVLNNQNGTPEHTHEYSTEYKYDETSHWFECECGEKSEQTEHSFTDGKCVCGYEKEEEHTHDFDEIKYDETHHWKECECGEKSEIEEHNLVNAKCECGYEIGVVHTHEFTRKTANSKYLKTPATCENKAVYYYSCKCGEKGEETFEYGNPLGHSFTDYKDNGDNTKTAECDNGCGKTNTIEKEHVHNYSSVVTPPTCEDKGYTTYTCGCGDTYRADEVKALGHNYGDFVSDGDGIHHTKTCKNDSDHKITENCGGGTATCTKKAECATCGGEYGSFKAHEYLNLKYNENYHWKECVCGDKTELVAHNGGSANCIKKAECATCGQQYGEYGDHAYGNWVSNNDGTHTKTCTNDNAHKVTENCTDNGNGFCVYCNATLGRVGEKIYFGSYPQTEVTDSALKTTLNNLAGTLPTSSNSRNWMSYRYYIEGSVQNYMWYIDVTFGGEKYRGVYFTSYRPCYTTSSSSASYTRQDVNGYYINTVYWFEYEPIEWRILSESGGSALIMANLILDSQAYQNEYYWTNDYYYTNSNEAPSGTYANNYKYSTIRSWLNDNFYNTAFSEIEKELIKTVTVDNSAESTGYNPNKYACENTNDKIFLLSYEEAANSAYGFSSDPYDYDPARQLKPTDYAQSQGCWTSTSTSYLGNGTWWLRSPEFNYGISARYVFYDSDIDFSLVYDASFGVVPALQIQLS